MKYLLNPITDYLCSRKRIWLCFAISIVPAIILLSVSFVTNLRQEYNIVSFFSDFITSQVNIIAILLSFSIAILTILATADNDNIRKLKKSPSSTKHYKEVRGNKRLTLFQVLLSSVTYNILCQILYLSLLIVELLLKALLDCSAYKYFVAINIFFIAHIFYVLIDSVVSIYYVFWPDLGKKENEVLLKNQNPQ